jgi:hypothetical protein
MNIGDKVRLLHDKQQGIITKFIDRGVVEIEIEDGFRISALKTEIVLVNKEEDFVFGKLKKEKKLDNSEILAQTGIYVCFKPLPDKKAAFYVVNNTDLTLQIAVFEETEHGQNGVLCAMMTKRTAQLALTVDFERIDSRKPIIIQGIIFKQGEGKKRNPFEKRLIFKKSILYALAGKMPVLGGDGYVMQIDDEDAAFSRPLPKPEEIVERMTEKFVSEKAFEPVKIVRPPVNVDLHAEHLTQESKNLDQSQILDLQLRTFERALDNAIASNMDEIIFIHGVGNGVLRKEIQKRLGQNPFVKYFQDAQKEKFGYGATLARLK